LVRDNPAFSMLNESDDDKEDDDEEELHAETDAMLPQRDRDAERSAAKAIGQSMRSTSGGGLPLLGHDDSD